MRGPQRRAEGDGVRDKRDVRPETCLAVARPNESDEGMRRGWVGVVLANGNREGAPAHFLKLQNMKKDPILVLRHNYRIDRLGLSDTAHSSCFGVEKR